MSKLPTPSNSNSKSKLSTASNPKSNSKLPAASNNETADQKQLKEKFLYLPVEKIVDLQEEITFSNSISLYWLPSMVRMLMSQSTLDYDHILIGM